MLMEWERAVAAQIEAETSSRRQVDRAALVLTTPRTGKQCGAVRERLEFVDRPRPGQPLARALLETLLPALVERVDLDRELAAHVVEQHPGDPLTVFRTRARQRRMTVAPVVGVEPSGQLP